MNFALTLQDENLGVGMATPAACLWSLSVLGFRFFFSSALRVQSAQDARMDSSGVAAARTVKSGDWV